MPSYIELDKNASIPTPTADSKIVLGITTSGSLSIVDSTNIPHIIGNLTTVTLNDLNTLISNKSLKPGSFYLITGADSNNLYGGTDIVLQAVTTELLSTKGFGKFYNATYDHSVNGFNIWTSYVNFYVDGITGEFNIEENVTGDGGRSEEPRLNSSHT